MHVRNWILGRSFVANTPFLFHHQGSTAAAGRRGFLRTTCQLSINAPIAALVGQHSAPEAITWALKPSFPSQSPVNLGPTILAGPLGPGALRSPLAENDFILSSRSIVTITIASTQFDARLGPRGARTLQDVSIIRLTLAIILILDTLYDLPRATLGAP
jgi:hypothetical protein